MAEETEEIILKRLKNELGESEFAVQGAKLVAELAKLRNIDVYKRQTIARAYQTDGGTTITPALTVAAAQDVSRMNPKSNVSGPLGAWNVRGVNVSVL